MRDRSLRELFSRDKKRVDRFSLEAGDLFLDYSKNHLNNSTRNMLTQLAKQARVPAAIDAMFSGGKLTRLKTGPHCMAHYERRSQTQSLLTPRACAKFGKY